jgi:hypothetical protein
MRIHVIVHLNDTLVVMQPMQSPYVLLQGAPPENRHGEKKRVQTGVVTDAYDYDAFGNLLHITGPRLMSIALPAGSGTRI